MGGRLRPAGGGSVRSVVGRGRRVSPVDMLVARVMWRSGFTQTMAFGRAARTHPMAAFAVLVYVVVWVQSGSGLVAVVVTPLFMGGGALVWFWYRLRRTGLGLSQSAGQLRRQKRVRQQWKRACTAADLPTVPPLLPWRVRSEGDAVVVVINAAQHGIAREPLLRGLVAMAEVVGGGCREAKCKPLGDSGLVELHFLWGSVLDNVVLPSALPAAPTGCAPFGLADTGRCVALPILNARGQSRFTPLLISGVQGAGKSSALWATLLGFIALGVPVRLWVADPAGGVELAALEDAMVEGAGTDLFAVVRYADDEASITAMITDMHAAMDERLARMKAQRLRAHVPTVVEPVHLLIIDELLYLDKMLKAGKSGPLGLMMIAGRKAAFSVVACTQMAKVNDIGPLRDLFGQRLTFRTASREGTEAAMGSGAGWADKAPAHRISRDAKGVGYAIDAEGLTAAADEATRFRAVYLDDEQVADIACGYLPAAIRPPAPLAPAVPVGLHVIEGGAA